MLLLIFFFQKIFLLKGSKFGYKEGQSGKTNSPFLYVSVLNEECWFKKLQKFIFIVENDVSTVKNGKFSYNILKSFKISVLLLIM